MLTSESVFERQVDQWVLDAVAGGHRVIGGILRALPGVYPTDVLSAVQRLAHRGALPASAAARVATSARTVPLPGAREYNDETGLPVPHPLDFEWRFTTGAIDRLMENILELSCPGDTIALLGTPSVFHRASKQQISQRNVVLVDANLPAVASLSHTAAAGAAICCDILHSRLPALTAQVVVIDPPWYPTYIRTFIWAASHMCSVGGYVLLSAPPVGTRPGIEDEWEQTLEIAKRTGLCLEQVQPSVLSYISPPFERNAMRAAGIGSDLGEWRRGNLVCFRCSGAPAPNPPPVPPPHQGWLEENVNGVRIRMREQENASFLDPKLVGIVTGDVLPSVSRRDDRRILADVWTSGNRIFRCENTTVLQMICRAIAQGKIPTVHISDTLPCVFTPGQLDLVISAAEQIKQIVSTERGELDTYGA